MFYKQHHEQNHTYLSSMKYDARKGKLNYLTTDNINQSHVREFSIYNYNIFSSSSHLIVFENEPKCLRRMQEKKEQITIFFHACEKTAKKFFIRPANWFLCFSSSNAAGALLYFLSLSFRT